MPTEDGQKVFLTRDSAIRKVDQTVASETDKKGYKLTPLFTYTQQIEIGDPDDRQNYPEKKTYFTTGFSQIPGLLIYQNEAYNRISIPRNRDQSFEVVYKGQPITSIEGCEANYAKGNVHNEVREGLRLLGAKEGITDLQQVSVQGLVDMYTLPSEINPADITLVPCKAKDRVIPPSEQLARKKSNRAMKTKLDAKKGFQRLNREKSRFLINSRYREREEAKELNAIAERCDNFIHRVAGWPTDADYDIAHFEYSDTRYFRFPSFDGDPAATEDAAYFFDDHNLDIPLDEAIFVGIDADDSDTRPAMLISMRDGRIIIAGYNRTMAYFREGLKTSNATTRSNDPLSEWIAKRIAEKLGNDSEAQNGLGINIAVVENSDLSSCIIEKPST